MTFTTDRFTNPYLAAAAAANPVLTLTDRIKRLTTDDQLALLWYIYTDLGKAITAAAPGAARLQLAAGLLNQVQQMSQAEQLQFMRDLVNQVSNPATRAYGVLSANTKLAFWYQLAEWMTQGSVIPMPADYRLSKEAETSLVDLKLLDRGQQITILRNVVVGMGVDPLAF
ncbi:orange carotenoid protein N-terminal domain-containing protein [Pantanalinema rosaneae CENA516]|uniref:orange carotenoid protein N-terminal domain-containing protein n=1 Tax=Pantanalinema rosaneae TaxID=1620701 RepID=UPI003D6E4404